MELLWSEIGYKARLVSVHLVDWSSFGSTPIRLPPNISPITKSTGSLRSNTEFHGLAPPICSRSLLGFATWFDLWYCCLLTFESLASVEAYVQAFESLASIEAYVRMDYTLNFVLAIENSDVQIVTILPKVHSFIWFLLAKSSIRVGKMLDYNLLHLLFFFKAFTPYLGTFTSTSIH